MNKFSSIALACTLGAWSGLVPAATTQPSTASAQADEAAKAARMQWFADAKFGIFIHWGIYAVDGITESWSFFDGYVSYSDYMKQAKGFTASH